MLGMRERGDEGKGEEGREGGGEKGERVGGRREREREILRLEVIEQRSKGGRSYRPWHPDPGPPLWGSNGSLRSDKRGSVDLIQHTP